MALTRLLTLFALALIWGAEDQGRYAIAVTVLMVASIVLAGGMEIANAYFASRRGPRMALVVNSVVVSLVAAAAAAIVVPLAYPLLPILTDLGETYEVLLAISIGPMVLYITLGGLMAGAGHFKQMFLTTAATSTLQLTIVAVVALSNAPPAMIFGGYVASVFAAASAYAAVLVKMGAGSPFDRRLAVETASYSVRVYPLNTLNWAAFRLDLLLVASILSTASAGVYALLSSLTEGLLYVAKSVAPTLFAARAAGRQDDHGIDVPYRVVAALTLIGATLLAFLVGPVLLAHLGPPYDAAMLVLVALCLAMLPMSIATVATFELAARGTPELAWRGSLAAVILTVGLVPFAAQLFGLLGVAVVCVLAYGASAAIAIRLLPGAPSTVLGVVQALVPRRTDLRHSINIIPGGKRLLMASLQRHSDR